MPLSLDTVAKHTELTTITSAVGTGLTSTQTLFVIEHDAPEETVRVYMVVIVGFTVIDDVVAPVFQENVAALLNPVGVKIAD